MYSPTYAELKANLEKELDLEDETFITPDEMLNYFNEAVDMIEAAIHNIYEDYFLVSTPLSLVSGTSTYSLPADIYAQKIRAILYNDGGANMYDIKRLKKLSDINFVRNNNLYQYIITNDGTSGLKLQFFPTPQETSTNITMWYLRNAKKFASDSDVCDIPEFTAVIIAYVRWKCMQKEGHPDQASAQQTLQIARQEMVDTLTARVPDEDNEITQDLSFYNEFDALNGGNW